MGYFFQYVHGLVLYCSIVTIYIYSFYLKSLGNASFEHVYTNAPHVRPIISAGLKLLCLVIQWCIHNASSISSCCWLLFRCYLSSLCSFMLFSVWQMDRKWVFGHVWEMLETVVPSSVSMCLGSCWVLFTDQVGKERNPSHSLTEYWWSVLVQGAELLPAPEELREAWVYDQNQLVVVNVRDYWCQSCRFRLGFGEIVSTVTRGWH